MSNIRNRIEKRFSEFGLLVSRRPWPFILVSALAVMTMVSQWMIPFISCTTSAVTLINAAMRVKRSG